MSINITAYTDGACSGNPGKGGYGAVILKDGKEIMSPCDGFRLTTNNRMEILGAARAVESINIWLEHHPEERKDTDVKVTVFSDSQLVVNTFNQGWARKSNRDLWKRLDDAVDTLRDVYRADLSFEKVKGHAGDKYNCIADQLAVKASQVYSDKPDKVYEDINKGPVGQPAENASAELTVREIRLCSCDDLSARKAEVSLSNGTVVTIIPCYGGFQQTDCTQDEASVTVDIAWRLREWLNGKSL